jgi:hypothetical protein
MRPWRRFHQNRDVTVRGSHCNYGRSLFCLSCTVNLLLSFGFGIIRWERIFTKGILGVALTQDHFQIECKFCPQFTKKCLRYLDADPPPKNLFSY